MHYDWKGNEIMEVDTLILGATFLSAGLLQICGDNCLVLERRPQAGYEFLNAMKTGSGYDRSPVTEEGRSFLEQFRKKGGFDGKTVNLPCCAPMFYQCLQGKQVLLNMELVSLERTPTGWTVTAHGVSGYRTWNAKRIIDTRVHPWMIASKTINILVNGVCAALPQALSPEEYAEGLWTLKCPVAVDADYITARKAVMQVIAQLPEGCKVVHVADMFDYQVQRGYPAEREGIVYLPSCAWENPFLAFDVGILYGKEHGGYGTF